MISILQLVTLVVGASALPLMPHNQTALSLDDVAFMSNIGYVLRGYDLMHGNPKAWTANVDPGFRASIFAANYSQGSVTPDGRFKQPDGLSIDSCAGTCAMSFASTEIAGTKSYMESLEVKVSASAGGWGAKFSASTDYKSVQRSSSSSQDVFTSSEAACCKYTAAIQLYNKPALDSNFIAGLQQMPEQYDATPYMQFIGQFGTHYIAQAQMGALFGQQSRFSKTAWSKMLEQGLDIKVAASYSGFGVSAAVDTQTDKQKQEAQTFSQQSSEQHIYTKGAAPPADGKPETWMQSTTEDPAPMQLKLEPLDSLLGDQALVQQLSKVLSNDRIGTLKTNLAKALSEYCESLKDAGVVDTCDAPGADPALPSLDFPVDDLKKFAGVLKDVTPDHDNKLEWASIRSVSADVYTTVSQESFREKMESLVRLFHGITPGSQNTKEWASIRDKMGAVTDAAPVDQFWGMIRAFSDITPGHANKDEWSRIRDVCNDILRDAPRSH